MQGFQGTARSLRARVVIAISGNSTPALLPPFPFSAAIKLDYQSNVTLAYEVFS